MIAIVVTAALLIAMVRTFPHTVAPLTSQVRADDLGKGQCDLNKGQLLAAVLVPLLLAIALAWALHQVWTGRKDRLELQRWRAAGIPK
jgi:hypothetical protein